jgi:2-oxoisovalerate dehydrogenase E1 component beta subunit
VIRTPIGGGIRGGHYHSQSPETYFLHTPGLKVVCPSNPYDAKGLLISAIRDDDPVMFFEPKRIYRAAKGEVPNDSYTVPIGEAAVLRRGADVTVVSWGAMVHEAIIACEKAAAEEVEAELIDLRTLLPLDIQTLIESVKRTGRLVVVHEAPRTSGYAGELITLVVERAFYHLQAAPRRVTGYDTPFPYTLEEEYLPLAPRILSSILEIANEG